MLDMEGPRWTELKGGYRTPVDLRPLLRKLEASADPREAWGGLWQELYHQGDVGVGSYVAVPHLVRIHRVSSPTSGMSIFPACRPRGRSPRSWPSSPLRTAPQSTRGSWSSSARMKQQRCSPRSSADR